MANDRESRTRREMARLGWNQETLAEKAGLSQSAISKFLDAKSGGRASTTAAIARALGVSSDYLQSGMVNGSSAAVDDLSREQAIIALGDAEPRALAMLRLEPVPQPSPDVAYWLARYKDLLAQVAAVDKDPVLSIHTLRERERRGATTPDLRPVEKQRRRTKR